MLTGRRGVVSETFLNDSGGGAVEYGHDLVRGRLRRRGGGGGFWGEMGDGR